MDESGLYIVFGNGKVETTLTHATYNGKTTVCGIKIPPEWYGDDDWNEGPECKRCTTILKNLI